MGHGIELPKDRVFSTEGVEWHGLAEPCEVIGEEQKKIVSFGIKEWDGTIEHEGKLFCFKEAGYKVLFAHMEHREDLSEKEQVFPLFIPRGSYQIIENAQVIAALEKAMEGIDYEITTIGTLFGGKRFFICVKLKNHAELVLENGEKILPYITFISSHDGSLAFEAYDCMIRVVCNNTLEWSRQAAGEIGFKIFHTKGAATRIVQMAELINSLIRGREEFVAMANSFAKIKINKEDAYQIALGFFCVNDVQMKGESLDNPLSEIYCSTRRRNAVEEIVRLAWKGKGNTGDTMWALLNGATEYWTDGDGSGKKKDKGKKLFSAHFGTAMKWKREFVAYLMNADLVAKGRKLSGKAIMTEKGAE